MKRIITICTILLSIATAKAQEGITLGIKGGMNRAEFKGRDVDSFSNGGATKSLSGVLIGVALNNKMSKHFWLKHEVFYTRRFMTVQLDDGINPIFSSNLKRQYIDLFPASPTYHYKGFQIYAGPYIGILLSAAVQRKDANGNLYTDKRFFGDAETLSKYSQKFDAGIVAGVEYELPAGFNFGARLVRGFVPLIENAAAQKQWSIYNQSVVLTIGYSFMKR